MFKMQKSQKGAVLVISLIMLVLMTIVVVISMKGSHVQEQMAGNEKFHVDAMLGAETGIAEAIACMRNAQIKPSGATGDPDNCNTVDFRTKIVIVDSAGASKGAYWVEEICGPATANFNIVGSTPTVIDCKPAPSTALTAKQARIKSIGYSVSKTTGLPTPSSTLSDSLILAQYRRTAIYDGCGNNNPQYGLVSKQNIKLAGGGKKAEYIGGMYAENDFTSTGSKPIQGDITALDGSLSAIQASGYNSYCTKTCGDNKPTPISINTAEQALQNAKDDKTTITDIDCSTLSGDLKGKSYRCTNVSFKNSTDKVSIDVNAYNGTFYYMNGADTNELTINGGVDFGKDGPINIVSKAGIKFAGAGDGVGTFLTNGQFEFKGSRDFRGTITARGDIIWAGTGGYQFENVPTPGICNIQATLQ